VTSLEIVLFCLCVRLDMQVCGIRKFAFEVMFGILLFSGVKSGSALTCFFSSFFPLSISPPPLGAPLLPGAAIISLCKSVVFDEPALSTCDQYQVFIRPAVANKGKLPYPPSGREKDRR